MSKAKQPFRRPQGVELARRLREPRRHIQVVAGARQVGKTTLVQQVTESIDLPVRFASADEPTLRGADWIAQQWEATRLSAGSGEAILVLDEVQKAIGWSESVKRLWDEETRAKRAIKVVLLGSAPLLVQRGLTESLAGRFEIIRLPHWSLAEMRAAFDFSVDQYLYFGGYPVPPRWQMSLSVGGATSSMRWSRLRSPETSCCSLAWTSRLCCDASSNWAVATRDRCCPTPRSTPRGRQYDDARALS